MKKKKIFLFISILIITIFKINVEAATCTQQEKNELKQEAKNLEIIPVLDSEEDPLHIHFYGVNFTNLSDKFYILDSYGTRYEKSSTHTNETVYGQYSPGSVVTFKIYGAIGKTCGFEHLATIRVTFEYYNDYYLSELCEGIEEFSLCQRNYSGTIESEEYFIEQVNKYKDSLKEKEPEEKEKTITETITKFIKDNPIVIIVSVLVLLIIIITIVKTIKNNKKKIKINLNSR